jgi:hypothetical protein
LLPFRPWLSILPEGSFPSFARYLQFCSQPQVFMERHPLGQRLWRPIYEITLIIKPEEKYDLKR